MRVRVLVLAVLLACAMAVPAFAAGKMAYVDLSTTFDQYEKTRIYDEKLTEVQAQKEKDLEQIANEIKALEDKMSLLSVEEKAAKQKELDEKNNKLRQMSQQVLNDMRRDRDEKLKEILQDIEKAVQEYAQKNGYDYIFNDRVLLYGAANADVTQDIIDQLNSGYKTTGKTEKTDKTDKTVKAN